MPDAVNISTNARLFIRMWGEVGYGWVVDKATSAFQANSWLN
jgi:hypothetical protein